VNRCKKNIMGASDPRNHPPCERIRCIVLKITADRLWIMGQQTLRGQKLKDKGEMESGICRRSRGLTTSRQSKIAIPAESWEKANKTCWHVKWHVQGINGGTTFFPIRGISRRLRDGERLVSDALDRKRVSGIGTSGRKGRIDAERKKLQNLNRTTREGERGRAGTCWGGKTWIAPQTR